MAKPSPSTPIATTGDGGALANGLVAVWPFWENTGNPVEIVTSTSAATATAFSWSTTDNGDPAGSFNGSSSSLTYSSLTGVGPAITIAVRFKSLVDYTWSGIITRTSAWKFLIGDNRYGLYAGGSGDTRAKTSSSSIVAGTWYSLIFADLGTSTGSGANIYPYINGVYSANLNFDTSSYAANNTNTTYIGNELGTVSFFNGLIDYIYIWDRQITSTEASTLNSNPWIIFETESPPATTTYASSMMDL